MRKKKKNSDILADLDTNTHTSPLAPSNANDAHTPTNPLNGDSAKESAKRPGLSKSDRIDRTESINAAQNETHENLSILSEYIQASTAGNILEATVNGVFRDKENVYWQCFHGPVTIRIPFEETFETLPAELLNKDTPRLFTRREQVLHKSINATIPFVITKLQQDPDNPKRAIALGSRIKALTIIRKSNFGANAIRPLNVGDTVYAQFMSVGNHGAWVTFRGIDVIVRAGDLTYRYLPDMKRKFETGSKIKLMIQKISVDPATGLPMVRVSGKAVELEDSKARRCLAAPNSTLVATITNKHTYKDRQDRLCVTTRMWLEGVDLPAFSNTQAMFSDTLHPGDPVYVKVLNITSSGEVNCKILRRAGNTF